MSAEHEKTLAFLRLLSLYAAEALTLQARMRAVQPVDQPSKTATG